MADNNVNDIFAMELDGRGLAQPVSDYRKAWCNPGDKPVWLNITCEPGQNEYFRWLYDSEGLDDSVLDSLTAEETRPRFYQHDNGLLVILRSLNTATDAEPGDMLSLRCWFEEKRIITIQRYPVHALAEIKKDLQQADGPLNSGDFLTMLNDYLSLNMADYLNKLDDDIDNLEDRVLQNAAFSLRQEIAEVRRQIIHLRRYLAPQREVLLNLMVLKMPLLSDDNRFDLRETGDRLTRYVETLDSGRERAIVVNDELESHQREQTSHTIFVLSIITAIFLPLTLLTGLLGINVGGIPGDESPYAFWLVCLVIVVIVILQFWIFRKKKLL